MHPSHLGLHLHPRRLVSLLAAALAIAVAFPASRARAQEPDTARIAAAARSQIGTTVGYDPAYRALAYPNGDVPLATGVCSDVVVRALRTGAGLDLQQLVHEDMRLNFPRYPQKWGLKKPDKNIDHRRVPNLQTYFKRQGYALPVTDRAADYRAGDLVTCRVPPNLAHIVVVSDRVNASGQPLIIHNIGAGAKEEDRLFEFTLTGHYRVTKIAAAPKL